ncbi:hypothetical protein XcodCFBP4690_20015 [Xanthomonas codiaei]|uniref:Uncharacterized protein n=1 Tax=Xanthomonas codiaei TaxID=56463 RepID=A0A2S7CAS9_9XANT|nr:hypothetical protein XcodCFBP4690_20015 [Xanthomonas codiaei]
MNENAGKRRRFLWHRACDRHRRVAPPRPRTPIRLPVPNSPIPNPQSPIPDPKSQIPNPKSRIPNPDSLRRHHRIVLHRVLHILR